MYYLYFLWSEKLQQTYIGITADIKKRLNSHNSGMQRSTKRGVPWILIGFRVFDSKNEAQKEEKRLKKARNRAYYRRYIQEYCQ